MKYIAYTITKKRHKTNKYQIALFLAFVCILKLLISDADPDKLDKYIVIRTF